MTAPRVVLVGAHNHAGPGNLYGSPYFDAFSTSFPWVRGFHKELADDLSERIADAVKHACAALRWWCAPRAGPERLREMSEVASRR